MVCASMGLHSQAAPASTDESGFQLTIELRDGLRLIGKGLDDTLNFHSTAMGDLKLTWGVFVRLSLRPQALTPHN
jgi:hypothetical protein